MSYSPPADVTAAHRHILGRAVAVSRTSLKAGGDSASPEDARARSGSQEQQIAHIVDRLERRHPGVKRSDIAAVAREVYDSFAGARIRNYVELLTEREAGELLRQCSREPAASALAALN